MGGVPVSFIRGAMFFVVADRARASGRGSPSSAPCGQCSWRASTKCKIVFQRGDAGHPDLEKLFDQIGMSRYEFFGPTRFNRVLTNVALEAHANHVAAHGKRNALRSRMRRAAGSKDEFLDLVRMIQGQ